MTPTAAAQPRGNLWRHADFLKLWTAATVSGLGDEITQLAFPTIAILTLEVSAFEVGLLGTIQFLPFILLTLPAGAWVDRLRRRPILIIGDFGRGLALASIPVAFLLGVMTIYQLYVVAFVVGCLTVFFDVAYQSYLPSLVERDQLVEGNGKLEVSRSGVQIAGPGVSGYLIGLVGAPIAIAADVVTFLVSAVSVFAIRKPEASVNRYTDEHGEKRPGLRKDVAEGLRYVLGHRHLRWIATCTATANLFSNVGFTILLVYVYREIRLTPEQVGLALSAASIGVLGGAILSSRIPRWIGTGPAILLGVLLSAPSLLLVALAPRDIFVVILVISGIVGGFGNVVYNVAQVSFRQAITPHRIQGRMNATMRFIVWGTIPVGALVGGYLGTVLGLREAILVGAIGSFLAIPPILFTGVRKIREIPGPEDETDAGDAADAASRIRDGGMASVTPSGVNPVPTDDDPERR